MTLPVRECFRRFGAKTQRFASALPTWTLLALTASCGSSSTGAPDGAPSASETSASTPAITAPNSVVPGASAPSSDNPTSAVTPVSNTLPGPTTGPSLTSPGATTTSVSTAPSQTVADSSSTSTMSSSTTTGSSPNGTTSEPTVPVPNGPDPAATQTSAELLGTFDLGWNLGNSLDVPEGETNWGNPTVDAALLRAVADAGFDVVRIPVTWSLFTGDAPNYTIEPARLARVREVVGYARSAGLYAIINLHHDGADEYDGVEWLTLNDESGAVTEMNNAAVEARFRAVWTQISEYFGDEDHGLLFESMNEIHDGYDAPDAAYYTIINHLNQVFIDIVRGSGGNNATRHLVVPGYNTNIDYTLTGFVAPADPTPNRLILSVHFYDPWSFAGEASTSAWGNGAPGADTWGQEDHIRGQFEKLKAEYIDAGLPMIVGEYGAVNQTGAENYRRYYMEYVTQAACQNGLVPIYWDNGGAESGPDSFALFDRTSKEILFPDILEAMFRGCASTGSLDSIAKP